MREKIGIGRIERKNSRRTNRDEKDDNIKMVPGYKSQEGMVSRLTHPDERGRDKGRGK